MRCCTPTMVHSKAATMHHKALPHAEIPRWDVLNTSKSHAMCCDAFSNMLEYLSHLLSDFQTVRSIVMLISQASM